MPDPTPVLILGAAGQLGHELMAHLRADLPVVAGTRHTSPAFDLAAPNSLHDAIHSVAPKLIINCAAYTAVDKAESEPELAETVNAISPGVIAEYCAQARIPLIHYSTDYVFDGSAHHPYTEEDRTAPLGVYGRTKLLGEQAIAASGCQHYIFRTSWVYAAHGQNFLNTMLRLATERDALSIVEDQKGSPTWTGFLVRETTRLLKQLQEPSHNPPASGVYHLTCSGETTWYDFAANIFEIALQRGIIERAPKLTAITSDQYPTPANRPHYSVLDNSKVRQQLQLQSMHWKEALENCLRHKA